MMSKLTFHRKPMPLMVEHRPIYKITQLLLVLYLSSRGKKSSLIRLHLFSWVLKDEIRKKMLLESANQNQILFGVWGVDPAVNISLQYAEAEGLISKSGLSYKLTQDGAKYVSEIDSEMAFKDDYFFLQSIGSKITEGMVENIIKEWE
ncbi:hypothetical protein [Oceanisphaera arctica]|uniref:Uncharacterized protein n=1 Tax=Oceanisphaera arctica TaxID=641510 RepID=A0A2P5TQR2_9GAMM|nr:hypothetical protein [Oceanisphaera arctica]PPL18104.1 hypothetical protein UN63_02815 [Oceanisphaera arctica]GHA09861.1 hypothetical protein GCM10007082_08630 [Oceanisphaera arctica]